MFIYRHAEIANNHFIDIDIHRKLLYLPPFVIVDNAFLSTDLFARIKEWQMIKVIMTYQFILYYVEIEL